MSFHDTFPFKNPKRAASTAAAVGAVLFYAMNKTCAYCGVVPMDHVCPHKRSYHKKSLTGLIEKFRSSAVWQSKRESIKRRDLYLCLICRSGKYGEVRYNSKDLQVHHIDPLNEAWERRLDDDNLITACSHHHKMAERGEIPREELRAMIPPS